MLYTKVQFFHIELSQTFFIAQIGAALVLGFQAANIYYSEEGKNKTAAADKKPDKEKEIINIPALVIVIGQLLVIVIAVSLIVIAVLHRAKYRKVLLVWLVLAFTGLIISIVSLFIRVILYKTGWIDILVTLIIGCYEGICCWLVLSYYKYLAAVVNHQGVGYNVFANENDFSTVESPTAAEIPTAAND